MSPLKTRFPAVCGASASYLTDSEHPIEKIYGIAFKIFSTKNRFFVL